MCGSMVDIQSAPAEIRRGKKERSYINIFWCFICVNVGLTCWYKTPVFTGSIVRSAKRRCLSYTEADFEFFSPRRGDTLHVDGVDTSNFSPNRCKEPKTEILLRFYQNIRNINAPLGHIPCAILTKFVSSYLVSGCINC